MISLVSRLLLAVLLLLLSAQVEKSAVRPVLMTEPVSQDADDPAIWIHPTEPERSLIVGTDKTAAPDGALVVYGLDGKIRQTIQGIDRPNNVDIEYGLPLRGKPMPIVVVTERLQHRLRVYAIASDGGSLGDLSSPDGLHVCAGEQGENAEPMGIGLYRRPKDGAIFAIIAPKGSEKSPRQNYLWQYRLEGDRYGKVRATFVRRFGDFSGTKEIEAIAVDDALGYVYYADEGDGIHKWHADPDHPDAGRELARFATKGYRGDREGIGIYARPDGTGYLVCTDQLARDSEYHVYRREGEPGNPHDHTRELKIVRGGADETDGLEVTASAVGKRFPNGLVIAMNSRGRNFYIYRWEDFAPAEKGRRK